MPANEKEIKYRKEIGEWISRAAPLSIPRRIWDKDASLWSKNPQDQVVIRERLGWLALPAEMKKAAGDFRAFAEEVRGQGITHAVLLGMGGSSLTSELFQSVFGNRPGYPRLIVLDSTDPGRVRDVEESVPAGKTLFIVSSKSGNTVEVVSLFKYFFEKAAQAAAGRAGRSFIAITDPGSPLEELAKKSAFRRVFPTPPDVGGRFSALTAFGLVPAALVGVDLDLLLDSAQKMAERTSPGVPATENEALPLGVGMAVLAEEGRDKLTLLTAAGIESFGDWVEQLVAESAGKDDLGIIPVVREPEGGIDTYGDDRFFVRLDWEGKNEIQSAGHPALSFRIKRPEDVGGEFFRWEMAVAIAGALLKINPFDEPDVQAAKDRTQSILKTWELKGGREKIPVSDNQESFWERLKTRDYVALLAFLPDREPLRNRLRQLQRELRVLTRLAVTLGFGPRYLHSTGQLHKGGPPTGVFVMITAAGSEDISIPGESYSFGGLELAQAMGDFRALEERGRRVLHFRLESPSEEHLGELCQKIRDAVQAQVS